MKSVIRPAPSLIVAACFAATWILSIPSTHATSVCPGCGQQEPQSSDKSLMKVSVIGPDGKPMPGAFVLASIWAGTKARPDMTFNPNQMLYTDDAGQATIELPDELYILRVWARADGHVPLFANWEKEDLNRGDLPPDQYTFNLIRGTEIGGLVKNEKGEPIAGARVQVMASATHPDGGRRPVFNTWYAEDDDETTLITDATGRWSLDTLPPVDDLSVKVMVGHPDYIDDAEWGEYQQKQGLTTAQFRDKSATIVMSQGIAVSGSVTTPDGQTVDSGLVVWGDNPYREQGPQEVRFLDGSFALPPLPSGEKRITVIAPGWSPQTRLVEISPMMEAVDFELEPGNTLSILVVDPEDNPIPGAWVQIESWRGVEAVYNNRHPNVLDTHIPVRADDGGLYRWTWAPAYAITVSVGTPGFVFQRDIRITADNETHVVKLERPGSISGTVTDKSTGKPVDSFIVIPVAVSSMSNGTERLRENRDDAQAARDGGFEISLGQFGQPGEGYRLRIESDGYSPLDTETFDLKHIPDQPRYELEPMAWPTGRVVDSKGRPVKDAVIHLASGSRNLSIRDFTSSTVFGSGYATRSGDEGSFRILPLSEPYTLIVGHADGIVEKVFRPGESPGDLQLQAWAAVEGHVLNEQGEPVAGLTVMADPIRYQYGHSSHIQHNSRGQTDADGFYQITNMLPMRYAIRTVAHNHEGLQNSSSIPVSLKPGETATVDFGDGIPVKGQFKLSDDDLIGDYSKFHNMFVPVGRPKIGLPEELEQCMQDHDWQAGWPAYKKLAESTDFQRTMPVLSSMGYAVAGVNPDGSFLVYLPQPGEYDMSITARGKYLDSPGQLAGTIGERVIRFVVDANTNREHPLDLGVIEIEPFPRPQIGDPVPDIVLETANDKTLTLESLKGHVVLLDFWYPQCEVCEADKAKLAQLTSKLAERETGSSATRILSAEAPAGGEFTRTPGSGSDVWLGGRLRQDDVYQLFKDLAIYSLPRYLIVDESGHLLYHGNLDGAIELLGNRQAQGR